MIDLIHLQINVLFILLDSFIQILLDQCLWNLELVHIMSSHPLSIILDLQWLHSYVPRMLFCSTSNQWFHGLRSLLAMYSPLCIQTEGGNLWLGHYNCSFNPEALHIRPLFLISLSKMVAQRFNQTLLEKAEAIH